MDKKDIRKYWGEVLLRAFKPAWDEITMRVLIIASFILLLTVGVSGVFLALGRIPNVVFENRIAEARTGASAFLVSLGVLFVLFIWGLYKVPPKMHEELGGFLENPFSLEIVPPKSISKTKKRWVSIVVTNDTNRKFLTRCYVKLDNIFDIDHKHKKGVKRRKNLTLSGEEQYPNQSGNQHFDIAATESKKVDVAIADPQSQVAYYTEWQPQRNKIRPGMYILNLVVYGNWKDTSYNRRYQVTLKFEGGNLISLTDIKEGWYEYKEENQKTNHPAGQRFAVRMD